MRRKGKGIMYELGDVVRIAERLTHDCLYQNQIGVIEKVFSGDLYMSPYYYVVVYNSSSHKFGCCRFQDDEISGFGFKLTKMIDAYARSLSDSCWRNSPIATFDKLFNFLGKLKKIRKKYKKLVAERCDV